MNKRKKWFLPIFLIILFFVNIILINKTFDVMNLSNECYLSMVVTVLFVFSPLGGFMWTLSSRIQEKRPSIARALKGIVILMILGLLTCLLLFRTQYPWIVYK